MMAVIGLVKKAQPPGSTPQGKSADGGRESLPKSFPCLDARFQDKANPAIVQAVERHDDSKTQHPFRQRQAIHRSAVITAPLLIRESLRLLLKRRPLALPLIFAGLLNPIIQVAKLCRRV